MNVTITLDAASMHALLECANRASPPTTLLERRALVDARQQVAQSDLRDAERSMQATDQPTLFDPSPYEAR